MCFCACIICVAYVPFFAFIEPLLRFNAAAAPPATGDEPADRDMAEPPTPAPAHNCDFAKPLGFLCCHIHVSSHISFRPRFAFQPNTFSASEASAYEVAMSPARLHTQNMKV